MTWIGIVYEFYGGKVFILVKKGMGIYLFKSLDGEELVEYEFEDFNRMWK